VNNESSGLVIKHSIARDRVIQQETERGREREEEEEGGRASTRERGKEREYLRANNKPRQRDTKHQTYHCEREHERECVCV